MNEATEKQKPSLKRKPTPIPVEVDLWTTAEIGAYLKIAPDNVIPEIACRPDFPPRLVLPKANGHKMHPRWPAKDVIAWAMSHYKRAA